VGEAIEWQQFINGKTHGKRYTWSDNGTLRKIESFKHGNSAGRQVIFYSNGVKHKEYTFVNSKTHGDYFQWHSNGNLYKHERYDYGQLRSSTTYK
jgi:antitoxin component YwqK of YwqJK toxin-antitoxin module